MNTIVSVSAFLRGKNLFFRTKVKKNYGNLPLTWYNNYHGKCTNDIGID
jgi:hypothetical protein